MVTILIVVGFIVAAIAGCEMVLWVRGMVKRIEALEREAERGTWAIKGRG